MFRGIGWSRFGGCTSPKARSRLQLGDLRRGAPEQRAGHGTTAIFQAIVVAFTGYMLYLTRRWAGVIWLGDACPRLAATS